MVSENTEPNSPYVIPHGKNISEAYPPGALEHLQQADPVLEQLISCYGLITRERNRPPLEALVSAIVGQQLSVRAAAAITARLAALFPAGKSVSAAELAAVPFAELRAVGLSSAKAAYIHDLAEKVDRGVVNLTQLPNVDDELVIQQLCTVKGIGRWTAEMFLIFSLGRLDVLAVEDMGLRAGIRRAYDLVEIPKAGAIRALAEPWRPYRTIATFYFWHHLHATPFS